MTSGNSRRVSQYTGCTQCGSSNWQSIELAYSQSARVSESGYQTISKFGQSIAPPEQRSLFGAPLFTAAGLGGGAFVFLPLLLAEQHNSTHGAVSPFQSELYVPAFLVAVIAFLVHFLVNARYNTIQWPAKYAKWQQYRVCRSCGHRFLASHDRGCHTSGRPK